MALGNVFADSNDYFQVESIENTYPTIIKLENGRVVEVNEVSSNNPTALDDLLQSINANHVTSS